MVTNDLILLRRKEIVGTIAIVAWGIFFLLVLLRVDEAESLYVLSYLIGWVFATYWVALDARFRGAPAAGWTIFAVFALPLALLFYFISRPPAPAFCTACGASLTGPAQVCPVCGRQTSVVNRVFAGLTESLAPGPLERAKHTAKYMAITLAAVVFFGSVLLSVLPQQLQGFARFIWIFSVAAYWILVPWWVYLDAMWRRMDAVPWAILTLLTNVFGLVTYLVIRYPDPSACQKCGAVLTVGLKRCPYCGSEAERTCPRCQASVKPDWIYCPSCSAQLPMRQEMNAQPGEAAPTAVSARGTVIDAATGTPIPGAEVKIDSKGNGKAATTDPLGRFVLADLEPRPYVLLASAEGYVEQAKAYMLSPATPAQVHFWLCPAAAQCPPSEDTTAAETPAE